MSHRLFRWWVPAVVAVLLGTGACRDSPTDLLPGIVAAETQPALALGVVLPDPTQWSTWASDGASGPAALDAWRGSWDLPPAQGARRREASYRALVDLVPGDRQGGTLRADLAMLRRALEVARSLPAAALPATVRAGLVRASGEATAAAAARDGHDLPTALVHVLRGADALREIGPEAVARTLVDQVERDARRIGPRDAYSPEDTERVRRLVQGGREALREGDWVLAIRRAYYAQALLTAH